MLFVNIPPSTGQRDESRSPLTLIPETVQYEDDPDRCGSRRSDWDNSGAGESSRHRFCFRFPARRFGHVWLVESGRMATACRPETRRIGRHWGGGGRNRVDRVSWCFADGRCDDSLGCCHGDAVFRDPVPVVWLEYICGRRHNRRCHLVRDQHLYIQLAKLRRRPRRLDLRSPTRILRGRQPIVAGRRACACTGGYS